MMLKWKLLGRALKLHVVVRCAVVHVVDVTHRGCMILHASILVSVVHVCVVAGRSADRRGVSAAGMGGAVHALLALITHVRNVRDIGEGGLHVCVEV